MSVQEIQANHKDFPTPQTNESGLAKVVIVNYGNSDYTRTSEMLSNKILSVNGSNYPELKGINRIYLDFVGGRIAKIKVFYTNDLKWTSVDEFVQKTAESLQLQGGWEKTDENYRKLGCNDVFVYAGIDEDYEQRNIEKLPYIELNAIRLTVEQTWRELDKNRNANLKEQERCDVFKP